MKYTVTLGGESHRCATPADLIACLQANPEAAAKFVAELTTDVESGALRIMLAEAQASAEQAERSLATVTAERDAAMAEAMAVKRNYNILYEMADKEGKALRARLAKTEAVAEACGLAADDITHVASAATNTLRRLARERDDARTLAEERRDYARAQKAKLSVECDDREQMVLTARIESLAHDHAKAVAERDEALEKVRWFVEKAADEKLDGYRELGMRAANAENERDVFQAALREVIREKDELKALLAAVARVARGIPGEDSSLHEGALSVLGPLAPVRGSK